jgi:uncharacterized protein YjbJ (UPF0337 family)
MSSKNKLKAVAKNIEGKIQEGIGNISGDPKDQAEGKGKQAQANVEHTIEDAKDNLKETID